jgi:nitrite reductase/ring-hydroxylating ferredoxin subunit
VSEFRVGSIHDFPDGAMRAVEVDDRSIAIVRTGDRLYAFDNFCTHEGVAKRRARPASW